MRIALLHPTYWPEVRRGSERLVHDLGLTLAERGHDVTLITGHPGPTAVAEEDGMRVVRCRRLPKTRLARWYELHVEHAPNVVWQLLRGDFDLAHAFYTSDGWAAAKARRLGGPPFVFSFHGIPVREYLVGRRYRLQMLTTAIRAAAATSVLSEAAAERFRRYGLGEPEVLPGGVFCADFATAAARADVPALVCVAALRDPYKRGELLFEAFAELRRERPDAVLRVARSRDVFGTREPALPDGAEWFDADDTARLARAYGSAWTSVLPSVEEAFGLVLLESLAAGTPVVATRSGGLPEIVSRDDVGRLFALDDRDDLVRAMGEALDLGGDPATAAACREHAARWDWAGVVERYEAVYETVLGSRAAAA